MDNNHEYHVPFSSTMEYDRSRCGDCVCSTCYKQEFCDHCSECRELSQKREFCYRYEGSFTY